MRRVPIKLIHFLLTSSHKRIMFLVCLGFGKVMLPDLHSGLEYQHWRLFQRRKEEYHRILWAYRPQFLFSVAQPDCQPQSLTIKQVSSQKLDIFWIMRRVFSLAAGIFNPWTTVGWKPSVFGIRGPPGSVSLADCAEGKILPLINRQVSPIFCLIFTPGCIAPSGGRLNWAVNQWVARSSNHLSAFWVRSCAQRLGIWSPKSPLASIKPTGEPWILMDNGWCGSEELNSCDKCRDLYTIFLFLFFRLCHDSGGTGCIYALIYMS